MVTQLLHRKHDRPAPDDSYWLPLRQNLDVRGEAALADPGRAEPARSARPGPRLKTGRTTSWPSQLTPIVGVGMGAGRSIRPAALLAVIAGLRRRYASSRIGYRRCLGHRVISAEACSASLALLVVLVTTAGVVLTALTNRSAPVPRAAATLQVPPADVVTAGPGQVAIIPPTAGIPRQVVIPATP